MLPPAAARAATAGPDDLCVMPYTSGRPATQGMHAHAPHVMNTTVGGMQWFGCQPEATLLGRRADVSRHRHARRHERPLFTGNTVVLLPRWDREIAAQCVQRYKVTSVDHHSDDGVRIFSPTPHRQVRSVVDQRMGGGGAAMPAAVAQRLENVGITYVEGYGLTETMAPTHINPPIGRSNSAWESRYSVPTPESSTRTTLENWGRTRSAKSSRTGRRYSWGTGRTPRRLRRPSSKSTASAFSAPAISAGYDEDGYFFMVDRLKRMINASGYKVWPTEVESLMYHHPAIQEACVIGARTHIAARR